MELKIFYYINKFRNSWLWRTQFGRKILLAILIIIGVTIVVNLPKFISLEASISVLLFLMFASFLILYKPRKPSPMEKAGYDWTKGQQKAIQEGIRRKQEHRAIHRMNEFMKR